MGNASRYRPQVHHHHHRKVGGNARPCETRHRTAAISTHLRAAQRESESESSAPSSTNYRPSMPPCMPPFTTPAGHCQRVLFASRALLRYSAYVPCTSRIAARDRRKYDRARGRGRSGDGWKFMSQTPRLQQWLPVQINIGKVKIPPAIPSSGHRAGAGRGPAWRATPSWPADFSAISVLTLAVATKHTRGKEEDGGAAADMTNSSKALKKRWPRPATPRHISLVKSSLDKQQPARSA